MKKSNKHYAVYFKGTVEYRDIGDIDGYYAESQPYYEWSFTKNLEDAKIWKTLEGALGRVNYHPSYSELDTKIVDIKVQRSIVKNSIVLSDKTIIHNVEHQIEFESHTSVFFIKKPRTMDMYGFEEKSSKNGKTVWEYYNESKDITYVLTEDVNKQIISGKIK